MFKSNIQDFQGHRKVQDKKTKFTVIQGEKFLKEILMSLKHWTNRKLPNIIRL